MSSDPANGESTEQPGAASPRPFLLWQSFGRALYTQNPFYLISVAFVLHGTKLWYRGSDGAFNPWPLMGIICGYILLVAATGFVLVRFGKVWDDARSILLTLLILFVELSLTFDEVLISQRGTGIALLLSGWGLAVAVSEGVLLGLRIRLPALYRGPYHLLLMLLFVYPLAIVLAYPAHLELAVWRIYLFSPLAGLAILTLIPAIRQGAAYVRDNGTPWIWPLYPWSLFVFLIVCLGFRAWALALSFDPVLSQGLAAAMQMESVFGTWFLVPLLIAVGILLLEWGLVTKNRWLTTTASLSPLLWLVLSIPWNHGQPARDFLSAFTSRVGSPLWVTVAATLLFFLYASCRRARWAEQFLLGTLLVAAFVGRQTHDIHSLQPLQLWPLAIVGLWQGFVGIDRRDSRSCLLATVCLLVLLRSFVPGDVSWIVRNVIPLHVAGGTCLVLGAVLHDRFAHILRKLGVPLLVTATLTAAFAPSEVTVAYPGWTVPAYLLLIVSITLDYAYLVHSRFYFFAALANGMIAGGRMLVEFSAVLERILTWRGAGYFVAGLAWFVLAVLISASKAGLLRNWADLAPRRRPPPKTRSA